jgi:hypothetical protein
MSTRKFNFTSITKVYEEGIAAGKGRGDDFFNI